jgi:hypothetical protein
VEALAAPYLQALFPRLPAPNRIIQPVIAGLSQVGFVFKLADYPRKIAPGTK